MPLDKDLANVVAIDRGLNLPFTFWQARTYLNAIHGYARARRCSPDAALGYLLARTTALVSPKLRLDTGVKTPTTLNLFVAVIGRSGVGKSSTCEMAKTILAAPPALDVADTCPIGSGEGIAEAFMGDEKQPAAGTGGKTKMITLRRQVRHNAFFVVDEGEYIAQQLNRIGTTLGESMRRAFTGETLGQTNGTRETSRRADDYTLGLVVNFQPAAAAALMSRLQRELGTPQRFLWLSAADPGAPDKKPTADLPKLHSKCSERMGVCRTIAQIVDDIVTERTRGNDQEDDFDTHKPRILCRVAAVLAIWDQRTEVSEEDWRLANVIWDTSCRVRASVIAELAYLKADEEAEDADRAAHRAERVAVAKEDAVVKVHTMARKIANKVHERGRLSNREIKNTVIASKQRHLLEEALSFAEVKNWIVAEGEHAWKPGCSRPS